MSTDRNFLLRLIATILFIVSAYLPNDSIIKIISLIFYLIVVNIESIKKILYKIKNNNKK